MPKKGRTPFDKDFEEVAGKFPKLSYTFSKKADHWIITGEIDICDVLGVYWGTFEMKIFTPSSYPYCIPITQELSKIIPRAIDWHINDDGICCVDIDHRLIYMSKRGIKMVDFITDKVYPYLANQLYRLQEKKYAGAEYSHHFDGVIQFYQEDLNLSPQQAIKFLESLLPGNGLGRNDKCLCGSEKKLKNCHLASWEFLKYIDPPKIKFDIFKFKDYLNRN